VGWSSVNNILIRFVQETFFPGVVLDACVRCGVQYRDAPRTPTEVAKRLRLKRKDHMIEGSAILAAVVLGSLQTSPAEVAGLVGLSGEVLASAGADVTMTSGMLDALAGSSFLGSELSALESLCEALSLELETAMASSWLGEQPASQGSLVESLEIARGQLAAKQVEIRLVACTALSAEVQSRVSTVIANASRRVTPEFRVLGGADLWWTEVEKALIEERRSQRTGETLDEDSAALLASIRADPAVQAASVSLAAHVAGITEVLTPPLP
jgi:hypothetical protein